MTTTTDARLDAARAAIAAVLAATRAERERIISSSGARWQVPEAEAERFRALRGVVDGLRLALDAFDAATAPPPAPGGPTRHNHDDGRALPFGRLLPSGECPRCDELRAGAPARTPAWTERLGDRARREARDAEDRRQHFAPGGPHATGQCSPVCTAFDW